VHRPVAARNTKLSDENDWPAERRLANELQKLSERVRKLRDEIRGSAIGPAESRHGPALPTKPERRLRSIAKDQKVRRKTQKGT
jgi:hypothetical protein